MTIGTRIEERRKAIRIPSQAALARRVGMPQSSMNSLIKRPYRWSPYLPQIARELRTTIDYLIGNTDDPDERAPVSAPTPVVEHVMLAVAMPPERALARMFEVLLGGMDRSAPLDEQALLLAKRLPIGLSQLRDLLPESPMPATPPATAEALATHDAEPPR